MAIPLPSAGSGRAPERRPRTRSPEDLTASLRRRLTSDLHVGRLDPGDRLPSIRAVARESGVDHRAVARAYRELEAEGLVEIRGRSGVRVRVREVARKDGGDSAGERARWLAGVLAEGWTRRVTPRDLRRMLEACTRGASLRCACVESNRDQMVAYCAEIEALSEMTMVPCYLSPVAGEEGDAAAGLREELRGADVVVTTPYHASVVREALGESGPPLVVLKADPQLAGALRTRLRDHGMTVVAETSEFGERLRQMYAAGLPENERLRVVLADDAAGVSALDAGAPFLLTRAARDLLPQLSPSKLLFPPRSTLARASVDELTRVIVSLTVTASPAPG